MRDLWTKIGQIMEESPPTYNVGSDGSIHDTLGDGTSVGSLEKEPLQVLYEILSEIEGLVKSTPLESAVIKKIKAARRVLRSTDETSCTGNPCLSIGEEKT